jgi:hypothetical protein
MHNCLAAGQGCFKRSLRRQAAAAGDVRKMRAAGQRASNSRFSSFDSGFAA